MHELSKSQLANPWVASESLKNSRSSRTTSLDDSATSSGYGHCPVGAVTSHRRSGSYWLVTSDLRDPRRVGLAAIGAAVGYSVALLVPGSTVPKIVFGLVVVTFIVVACLVMPLPAWREARDRRATARTLMIGEAGLIVVVATAIALR